MRPGYFGAVEIRLAPYKCRVGLAITSQLVPRLVHGGSALGR